MKKKRAVVAINANDLTLNDSANAPIAVRRPSKKMSFNKSTSTVDDDADIPDPEDTAYPDRDTTGGDVDEQQESTTPYRIILPEWWAEISKHIRPEDVSSFARICRATYEITLRASFWFEMYKNYGPKQFKFGAISVDLPMRLRPESMVRMGGLRACVIRTLFYTYRPFVRRLEMSDRNLELSSFSSRLKVLQMWHVQLKPKLFGYYFRLEAPAAKSLVEKNPYRDPNRNVLENPEEGRRILYIESTKYVPLPVQTFDQTQQKYLKSVTYNISQGFRSYKVNMEFVLYNRAPFKTWTIDPACLIKVWDWWHPFYHQIKNAGKYYIPPEDDFYFNL